MKQFFVATIVEGHGEERAVPLLINQWFRHRNLSRFFSARDRAVRAAGSGALKAAHNRERDLGVEHYVERALWGRPDAILIVMDSDDECWKRAQSNAEKLGPEILRRANTVAPPTVPVAVIIANREYEVWFLAQLRRLRMRGALPMSGDLSVPADLESIPSPKANFERRLGRSYQETIDQQDITAHLGFHPKVLERCPSYRKLDRELQRLTAVIRKLHQNDERLE